MCIIIGLISATQAIGYDIINLLAKAHVPLLVTSDGLYERPTPDKTSTFLLGDSLDTVIKVSASTSKT